MRTIRPERTEHLKIKKAFRAATVMKWGSVPLMLFGLVAAFVAAYSPSHRYLGLGILLLAYTVVVLGHLRARCPRCGQIWWSRTGLFLVAPVLILFGREDETDSFVCRRCGLDIGFGLRQ